MRFLCDAMLAKLASYLRIFGYDTYSAAEGELNKDIVAKAKSEDRVLLTRNKSIQDSFLVTSDEPKEQMKQVVKQFNLEILLEPVFERCTKCNATLEKSPETPEFVDEAWRCRACHKLYWKGGHWKNILSFAEELNSS